MERSSLWNGYCQFYRKHDGTTRTPKTTRTTSIDENLNWESTNDPCTLLGSEWRIPTYTELNNVLTDEAWTDWNVPWNSVLKMHASGGLRFSAGALYSRGILGTYWTRIQSNAFNVWALYFYSCMFFIDNYAKANGSTLRYVRDH